MNDLYQEYSWKEFKEIIMVKEVKRIGNKIILEKILNGDILELTIENNQIIKSEYIER